MPDQTHEETLEHVESVKSEHTQYLVQKDTDIKGEVDISVRLNDRFDVTVYKGGSEKPRKIEDISKERLIEMLQNQL